MGLFGLLCVHLSFSESNFTEECDKNAALSPGYAKYFKGMDSIYQNIGAEGTCYPLHKECGWPKRTSTKLPLLVFSLGLEGAGHHLWTELLNQPLFDCVWINGRYYHRDLADGVARTTLEAQYTGFKEHLQLRKQSGQPPCKRIYDAEDSFPTGAIRKNSRLFMRPDLVHLQALDGILYDLKFLIITRNITVNFSMLEFYYFNIYYQDTALSALRRNFFLHVALELRTVEHTLTYVEAALRKTPCHRIFIAHYEHVLADPRAFLEPLSQFLELSEAEKKVR